jgi:hypothetical protein
MIASRSDGPELTKDYTILVLLKGVSYKAAVKEPVHARWNKPRQICHFLHFGLDSGVRRHQVCQFRH